MRYFVFTTMLLTGLLCHAQGWQRHFRMPHTTNNYTKAIFEISPGHYMAFGTSQDTTNGGYSNKLRVIGLDASGQVVWSKQYGDTNFYYYDNSFTSRFGYKQGNDIYYVGTAQNGSEVDGVLIKFNTNGDTLWQRIYKDTSGDISLQRMTASVDGGFLLTGIFQNSSTRPCLVIKINQNGHELWRKKIHKAAPDAADGKAIVQDSATKKIIIGGYQYIGNALWNCYDNILILDSLGNDPIQTSMLGMGGAIMDLIQTKDKKIVAVGAKTYSIDGSSQGINRSYIVKFDIANPSVYLWQKEYQEQAQNSSYTCVQELPNGDLLAGGVFDTSFYNNRGYQAIICMDRFNANGNTLSQSRHFYKFSGDPTENNQELLCLNPTSDGGYIAAIQTLYYVPYDQLFFVKYDSLFCDSTQMYCASHAVVVGMGETSLEDNYINIYPNPVKDALMIEIPNGTKADVQILNVLGQRVKELVVTATSQINCELLPAGVYFLELKSQGKTNVRRFIRE